MFIKVPFIFVFIYYLSYVFLFSFIPKINFTNPRKNFGTFFTTIVIYIHSPFYLQNSHEIPIPSNAAPTKNSQPATGSNNTKSIPRPIPAIHTPIVLFNSPNININYLLFIYYILFKLFLLPN